MALSDGKISVALLGTGEQALEIANLVCSDPHVWQLVIYDDRFDFARQFADKVREGMNTSGATRVEVWVTTNIDRMYDGRYVDALVIGEWGTVDDSRVGGILGLYDERPLTLEPQSEYPDASEGLEPIIRRWLELVHGLAWRGWLQPVS